MRSPEAGKEGLGVCVEDVLRGRRPSASGPPGA